MMRVEAVPGSGPTFQAVELLEAKGRLGIDSDDRDFDLLGQLTTATEDIGGRIDMTLCRQTLRGWLDAWPTNSRGCLTREIVLPFAPAVSLASITTYDASGMATVMDPADVYFSPSRFGGPQKLPSLGRVVLNAGASWPTDVRPVDGIALEWVAGFATPGAIPERARNAVILLARYLFDDETSEPEPKAVNNLLTNLRPWAF